MSSIDTTHRWLINTVFDTSYTLWDVNVMWKVSTHGNLWIHIYEGNVFVCVCQIWMEMTFCPTGQRWRSVTHTPCRSGAQSAPWGLTTAKMQPTTTSLTQRWPVGTRTAWHNHTDTARVRHTQTNIDYYSSYLSLFYNRASSQASVLNRILPPSQWIWHMLFTLFCSFSSQQIFTKGHKMSFCLFLSLVNMYLPHVAHTCESLRAEVKFEHLV